jgi:hypothetical protein
MDRGYCKPQGGIALRFSARRILKWRSEDLRLWSIIDRGGANNLAQFFFRIIDAKNVTTLLAAVGFLETVELAARTFHRRVMLLRAAPSCPKLPLRHLNKSLPVGESAFE